MCIRDSAITSHNVLSVGPAGSKTFSLNTSLANATNSDTACFKSMVIGSTTFNRADEALALVVHLQDLRGRLDQLMMVLATKLLQ